MTENSEEKTGPPQPFDSIVEGIVIHAPDQSGGKWWIREDLAARFREPVSDVLTRLSHYSISYPADTPRWTLDLMSRLTVSNDGPMFSIEADDRADIVTIAQWIEQYSDPRDRRNWRSDVPIEPGTARLQRPVLQVPATFEDLVKTGCVSRSHVPIEAVQRGDRQVVAARYPEDPEAALNVEPVISLDSLADFPEVVSVIAATPVEARRPLTSVRELFLLPASVMPDATTFRNLPGLENVYSAVSVLRDPDTLLVLAMKGRCIERLSRQLALEAFPDTLRRLAVSDTRSIERFDALGRLTNLEELSFGCDRLSLKAVGALTKLRSLRIRGDSGTSGWNALRHCVLLEEAFLWGFKAKDLRAFRDWNKLRRLGISGRGLRSLAGIEAFAALEELELIMVAIDDLTPLSGHQTLNGLKLCGTKGIRDLGPLAELPRLRRLEIEQAGIEDRGILHVRSLQPLARCGALESLSLHGTIIDDADLAPLTHLPSLRLLKISWDDGSLANAINSLRCVRPDIDIEYHSLQPRPGRKVGEVMVHPPEEGVSTWWIRDDLTELLNASTNYAAEKKLRRALSAENTDLLNRLEFDSEGGAVVAHAKNEEDIRALANLINRLAAPSR